MSTEPPVEFVFVEHAVSTSGWGVSGVWPKHLVRAAPRHKPTGVPVLEWGDCLVGQGPGWEPDLTMDEEWIKEACKRMTGWERPAKNARKKPRKK